MSVKSIKEDAFEEEVVKSELPVLIDFWAEWCGPCKEVSPILEEISTEMSDSIKIVKVNIDENPTIAQEYNIRSIPALMIFKDGKRID